ncbi:hypothetical protein KOW79_007004 [Hemibagrus wyckioides]|uniref:Uncharacterized protein n=1 Tax=Hemibagrus wyckioides TaxID=337641 RepID=A0A9D3NX76_9TELE|nr:uncharacterized protein LOC131357877 [Hemibagrus wyckioides]KAG7328830.1 hypothetical protein KOW79_007004 [Hemibagrus wyckioides]
MTSFWILILIFSTMYTVQPAGHWVTAQSLTESPVYQPDKELIVNIGDSATLRCCYNAENVVGIIDFFKQPNRNKPQIIVTVYKTTGETFYNESHESHFRIERSSNCFSMTILNITQSDEAMYFCAVTKSDIIFGDGTYLKIKETYKPLWNNSVVCEPTLHGNNTNMNSQHKTVIGLGTALGLCALLIFCLTYYILRRRKCDKLNASTQDYLGTRQEYEEETLNYTPLQFSKKKAKAEKRKTGSSVECVYSDVNTTVRYNS